MNNATSLVGRNAVEPTRVPAREVRDLTVGQGWFDFGELRLTWIILLFSVAAIIVFYLLLRHERSTAFTLRLYIVMLIVFGTLLVVSSGYSTNQLTPVVGLFGTIAGYLMGRSERNNEGR